MSRLSSTDAEDLPPRSRARPRILRQRRRRPLHPEAIEGQLRERASQDRCGSSLDPAPFGWLVLVYLDDQIGPNGLPKRIVRVTEPGVSLEGARAILDAELRTHGPRNAWIVARKHPAQRTVRP